MEMYQQTLRISYKKPRLHRYTHRLTLPVAHTSFPSPHPNRRGFHPESTLIAELVLDDLSTSPSSSLILYPATCPLQGCLPTGTKHPLPRSFLCILVLLGQGWAAFCPPPSSQKTPPTFHVTSNYRIRSVPK